jgi:hypothetical protein
MRLPLMMVDASSPAALKASLVSLAASQRNTPCQCFAGHINNIGRQIGDSYTTAQAIAAYTEVPWTQSVLSEATRNDSSVVETTLSEKQYSQPPG